MLKFCNIFSISIGRTIRQQTLAICTKSMHHFPKKLFILHSIFHGPGVQFTEFDVIQQRVYSFEIFITYYFILMHDVCMREKHIYGKNAASVCAHLTQKLLN